MGTALVWTGSRRDGQSLLSRACLLRERTGALLLTRRILFLLQSRRAEGQKEGRRGGGEGSRGLGTQHAFLRLQHP